MFHEGTLYKRQKIDLNKEYPLKDLQANPTVPDKIVFRPRAVTTGPPTPQVVDLTISDTEAGSDGDDESDPSDEEEKEEEFEVSLVRAEEGLFNDDVGERITESDEETEFIDLSTDASSSSFDPASSSSSSSSSEEEVSSTATLAEEVIDLMSDPEGEPVTESDFVVGDGTVSVVEESDMGETCFPDPEVEDLLDFMSPVGSPVTPFYVDNNSLYGIPHGDTGTGTASEGDSEEEKEVSPLAVPVNPSEHSDAFAKDWKSWNESSAQPNPKDMIYFSNAAPVDVDVEALADEFFTD